MTINIGIMAIYSENNIIYQNYNLLMSLIFLNVTEHQTLLDTVY